MRDKNTLISETVKEYYDVSSENQKFVFIIETINATDNYSSSLMFIIQRQE
jgi:hypothetical protein